MYCSNCGSEVKEGQAVCLNCGFSLKGTSGSSAGSDVDSYFAVENDFGAKRSIALLLGFFLGTFGAHRIYMKAQYGYVMLVATLVSCILILPLPIMALWGLVDTFRLLVASNEEYDQLFLKEIKQ